MDITDINHLFDDLELFDSEIQSLSEENQLILRRPTRYPFASSQCSASEIYDEVLTGWSYQGPESNARMQDERVARLIAVEMSLAFRVTQCAIPNWRNSSSDEHKHTLSEFLHSWEIGSNPYDGDWQEFGQQEDTAALRGSQLLPLTEPIPSLSVASSATPALLSQEEGQFASTQPERGKFGNLNQTRKRKRAKAQGF